MPVLPFGATPHTIRIVRGNILRWIKGDLRGDRGLGPGYTGIPDRLAVLVDGAFPGDHQVWAALMLEAHDGE